MQKFYFIDEKQLRQVNTLMKNRYHNEYVILNKFGDMCDIAQYNQKYDNVHFCTVPFDKLDPLNRLP